MRERLMALEESGKPIRVSLIGCGRFGSMMVAQIMRAPGMDVAVACDLDRRRAASSLAQAGYDPDEPLTTDRLAEANDAIRQRKPVVTDDAQVAVEANVDVVVEATGRPDAGATHASKAIAAGRHIVMVNVEADVLVGPVLKRMADEAGVVYSLAYGDQPALIEELYDWAMAWDSRSWRRGRGQSTCPSTVKGRRMTPCYDTDTRPRRSKPAG